MREVGRFIVSVISHWQAYATGGTVTGIIGVTERLTKLKLTKGAYAAIFLGVFLLCAFFLAWRDEYQRAERLQEALDRHPSEPSVQVNVPPINMPPPQVIIERPEGTKESELPDSRLELAPFVAAQGMNILTAGQMVGMNVTFFNRGPGDVDDVRNFEQLAVVDAGDAKAQLAARRAFSKAWHDGALKDEKKGIRGPLIGPGRSLFNTARSPVLTQGEVDGILKGTSRLYIQVWLRWNDLHGRIGSIDQCWFFQQPPSTDIGVPLIVHSCD